MTDSAIVLGRDANGLPILVELVDAGITDQGRPIYKLAVDASLSVGPITIGAVNIQDAGSLADALVAPLASVAASDNALAVHDAGIGQLADVYANKTIIGYLFSIAQAVLSLGVSGAAVVSADASGADVPVTDAPGGGKHLYVASIQASTDTAGMQLDFKEETSGTLIYRAFLGVSGNFNIVLGGGNGNLLLPTVNKKLVVRASKAGNIAVSVQWHAL